MAFGSSDGSVKISTDLDTDGVKKAMDGLGGVITKGAAAAVAALGTIGAAAVKIGSDFEKEMANLKAITGMTTEEMKEMEDGIRKAAIETGVSVTDLAKNSKMVAEAGGDINKMMEQITQGATLAVATQSDLATTLDFVGSAMKTFGLETEDTQGVIDSLAYLTTIANVELSQISASFVSAGGSAAEAGLDINDVSAILYTFAERGLKGGDAGDKLNTMLRKLTTPSNKARDSLDELGVSLYNLDGSSRDMWDVMLDLESAFSGLDDETRNYHESAILGADGLKGFRMIMDEGVGSVMEMSAEIANSTENFNGLGQAAGMAATQQETFSAMVDKSKAILSDMGITLYQKMEEPMKNALGAAIDGMSQLSDSLRDGALSESFDRIAEGISGFVGWLVELAIQAVPNIMEALVIFMDIVESVGEVVGRIFEAIIEKIAESNIGENIDKIKEAFGRMFESIDGGSGFLDTLIELFANLVVGLLELATTVLPPVIDFIGQLVELLGDALSPVVEFISGLFSDMGGVFEVLIPLLSGVLAGFVAFQVIEAMPGIVTALSGGVSALGEAFAFLLSPVGLVVTAIAILVAAFVYLWETNEEFREKMIALWEGIVESLSTIWESITGIFTGFMDHLRDNGDLNRIKELWEGTWNAILEALDAIWTGIMSLADAVFGGIADFFKENSEGIKDTLTGIWDKIWGFIEPIWKTINETATKIFGGLKTKFGEWFGGIRDIISGVLQVIWEIIKKALDNLQKFWDEWGDEIMAAWNMIWGNIKTTIETIWNQIQSIIDVAINTVKGIINLALSIIKGDWEGAWDAIKSIFSGFWEYIQETLDNLKNFIINIFNNVKTFLSEIDLLQIGKDMINGLVNGIKSIGTGIADFFKGIMKDVTDFFANFSLFDIGANIINGLWNGIQSIGDSIVNGVKGIGSSIANGFKDFFGISSPSKLMTKYGEYIMQGLGIGIENEVGSVLDLIDDVAKEMADVDFDISKVSIGSRNIPGIGVDGGGVSAQSTITNDLALHFHLYYEGTGDERIDMDEIGRRLAESTARELRTLGVVTV